MNLLERKFTNSCSAEDILPVDSGLVLGLLEVSKCESQQSNGTSERKKILP